jgi:putative hydrolase of the HAD superfamily
VTDDRADRAPSVRDLPKAVFFDMDDTIFDHALTCRRALDRLRASEPRFQSRDLDDIWHEYSRLLEVVQPDVLAGRITVQEARVERFRQLAGYCGTEVSVAEAGEFSRQYRAHYQKLRRTVPWVRRVLKRLRGRTVVGVVSNNQVAEQERKLDHLHLRPLIDFMIVSEGVGVAKPDPAIFQIALGRADALPEETVMIGDSWKSDITGARNAGIRAVWFNRFHLPALDPWPVPELDSFRSPLRTEAVLAGEDLGRGFPS